jgi:hypothetical protein
MIAPVCPALPARGRRGKAALRSPGRGGRSVPPERPDLDRPRLGDRARGRGLDGLLRAAALDDVEPATASLVSANGPSVTIAFPSRTRTERARRGGANWSPLTHMPAPGGRQAREALLVRSVGRIGLGLGVHVLSVPADQQQVFHRRSSRRRYPALPMDEDAPDRNRHIAPSFAESCRWLVQHERRRGTRISRQPALVRGSPWLGGRRRHASAAGEPLPTSEARVSVFLVASILTGGPQEHPKDDRDRDRRRDSEDDSGSDHPWHSACGRQSRTRWSLEEDEQPRRRPTPAPVLSSGSGGCASARRTDGDGGIVAVTRRARLCRSRTASRSLSIRLCRRP